MNYARCKKTFCYFQKPHRPTDFRRLKKYFKKKYFLQSHKDVKNETFACIVYGVLIRFFKKRNIYLYNAINFP